MNSFFSMLQTLVVAAFAFAATLFSAVAVGLIVKDAETFIPRLAKKIVERAVSRLPECSQDVYRSEWIADLCCIPETLGKLTFALDVYFRGCPGVMGEIKRSMRREYAEPKHVVGGSEKDHIELLLAEIATLEVRRKQLAKWFRSANVHELRRQGEEKSLEAEAIAKKLKYLKGML